MNAFLAATSTEQDGVNVLPYVVVLLLVVGVVVYLRRRGG